MKAYIQNVIAALPSNISYSVYYRLQRKFGTLKNLNPVRGLKAGLETWKLIKSLNIDPSSKMFFEVGTGRVPVVPIVYWLMGAQGTITIDLNPYLEDELVQKLIQYFSQNRAEVENLLFPYLRKERLDEVIALKDYKDGVTAEVLKLCRIKYIAPGDAANTGLDDRCIDFYTSNTVFEHIQPDILRKIIIEGNRITTESGLFIHLIDYSDHFSHSDKNITPINFLKYSDSEWNRYGGNRYMYMNRLRHDDFLKLFESEGHRILLNKPNIDPRSLGLLKLNKFPLNEKYKGKSAEILATSNAWILTQKTIQPGSSR